MPGSEVSIVTGASGGIGRAIALKLAAEGHSLALFGRDDTRLKETLSLVQNNSEGILFTGDVADENFVNSSVKEIISKFGKIDNLINNAGAAVFKKFVDSTLADFKQQVNANMYGVFNFSKAVIDQMIEQKSGSIINIASLSGKNGFVYGTTYSATKHAVMGFSKSLMLEVRVYNIRVVAICPGSVNTDMIVDSPVRPSKIEKTLSPKDVADVVASIIKLPQRALVNEIEIRPTNTK